MNKLLESLLSLFTKANPKPTMLQTMRSIQGTHEVSGSGDNPVILAWPAEVATAYPDMTQYCKGYNHDSIPWCGLTVALCATRAGYKPPYNPSNAYHSFLWAKAWEDFGEEVDDEDVQPGDVVIFSWGHVTLFVRKEGDRFICLGGNQSDQVKESSFPASSAESIRRAK